MTTIKSYTTIFLILLCCILTSFTNTSSEAETNPIAGKWMLIQFYPVKKDTFNYKELVVFQVENEGMTSGFLGCNKFRTECETRGNGIHFSTILSSRKFCNKTYMDLEDHFKSILTNANIYSINENILTLYEDKKKLASFKKQ